MNACLSEVLSFHSKNLMSGKGVPKNFNMDDIKIPEPKGF